MMYLSRNALHKAIGSTVVFFIFYISALATIIWSVFHFREIIEEFIKTNEVFNLLKIEFWFALMLFYIVDLIRERKTGRLFAAWCFNTIITVFLLLLSCWLWLGSIKHYQSFML